VDYRAAFYYVLEARELLNRTDGQPGSCGNVMRPRLLEVFQARQRDMAEDFGDVSPPVFVETF
jgi:hypothetical protein